MAPEAEILERRRSSLSYEKKLVEVLTAQAQSLIADIDKLSAKILLDEDEEAKRLALEKLAGQRVSLEKHIAGWRESTEMLEEHLRIASLHS